jgi:DNA polymerase III delta prime subunit
MSGLLFLVHYPHMHHALLSYGSPKGAREFALFIAKELGVKVAGNPDFHIRRYATLDVEEARGLRDLASLSGVGGKRVFVIAAQAIGREAQNALLKIIEEPGEGTTFALRVPRGALIPTVLSRLSEISFEMKKGDNSDAKDFLTAAPPVRSKMIERLVKDKDKEGAYELVCDIEAVLARNTKDASSRAALEEIARMRSYLTDPSASIKMILEHLALALPKK